MSLDFVVCKQQRPRPACSLECKIAQLAICKVSIVYLVSVPEYDGLTFTLSDTPKPGFLESRSI